MARHDRWLQRVLLTGLLCAAAGSTAAPNMKLFGTLLVPPACTISDNGVIDVFFGDNVGVHKVDGVNYTRAVNYTLVCEDNNKGWDLGLSVTGPVSGFDDAALQTNIPDLAIHLTQNGKPFTLNKRIAVSPDNPPVIQAVPVKRPGSTLPEGAFDVTATLLAEYQ
ncbi:fimbrial protein [Morganella morganii]|uniref:fimbrial protein n=1 Tax=Morganella TaxID=581 RepID=UPI000D990CDD|nr:MULTISPECIES: fimbrial protein [Morganella]EJD6037120.1 fimbrial protein [Morganella morganii]EKU5841776.1 fimbrial protein [Morganella morganii]MBA5807577.1 fimbrial protein [Morganella morganii]MBS9542417.1 fimbrial protein [Morganella morganii subsp. morganii]QXO64985.1 fimbrial protein [Morganella morganii]